MPALLVGLLFSIWLLIAGRVLVTLTVNCTVAYSSTAETDRTSVACLLFVGLVWLASSSKASERLLLVVCLLRLRDSCLGTLVISSAEQ
jgi:hypothetical protein